MRRLFNKSKVFKRRDGIWPNFKRRMSWLIGKDILGNSINLFLALLSFLLRRKVNLAYPVILKVDINSNCNLRCTVCVHANPGDNERLKAQNFNASQVMVIEDYRRVVEECKGKTSSVSLYYLGDPLLNRDLTTYAKIAREAGMNVHVSTNFSFSISDSKMVELATSGITHFTVCVDGFADEVYSKTRVGGKVDLVKKNLATLCTYRNSLNIRDLTIEVQHLEFAHNRHESGLVVDYCKKVGVDHISIVPGSMSNYTDTNFESTKITNVKQEGLLPKCFWPFLSMVIKYDGNVLPCCTTRLGEVYTDNPPDVLGNVFESGVMNVWNSYLYRLVRQSSINPEAIEGYLHERKNFCAGCSKLCNVEQPEILHKIKQLDFDKIFENSAMGSVRKF